MLILQIICNRLKSLVAIPGVSPGQAIAIEKKYPSMRSLLNVYMDDSKSVSAALLTGSK
jgi:crossover junction endonuclease EME1